MTELKPCPFCGGKAYFKILSKTYGNRKEGIDFKVKCKKCGVEANQVYFFEIEFCPETELGIKVIEDEREEAIADWNRRGETE